MIRDLAEETIDGSALDDFSASSMMAIIGRQLGVISNWFVQSPNVTRSCKQKKQLMDHLLMNSVPSSMLVIIGRQDRIMSN